jgi:ribosomal protein S24E
LELILDKMQVLQDRDNKLLNRKEVKVVFESSGNPGKEKAKEVIVSEFKVTPELVKVESVKGKFGRNTFLVNAIVYSSKDAYEKIEGKIPEKKEEAEEKPVEEVKVEEKPAEEASE